MNWIDAVAMGAVSLAGVAAILRVVRRGTLADRIVGLDALLMTVAAGVVVFVSTSGEVRFLPFALVVTLLGFVATATIAHFVEQKGPE